MMSVREHRQQMGTAPVCEALGIPRSTVYRQLAREKDPSERKARPIPVRALSSSERIGVLEMLHSERFVDKSPGEVFATLLDEQKYICSERTMYRILASEGEVRERRNQLSHPEYKKPELLATGPNQIWSWDITKLKGPVKWTYFYLYVLLDIFSRYVVGWLLARQENAALAKRLIEESCEKQEIEEGQLTIHSDRGIPMRSKCVAQLLADLGVTKSHSRPYVSDDNPFSEAQFKTMKYRPEFPDRFGSQEHGLGFCREFFPWYNTEHRHSGIGMLTPAMVHYGLSEVVLENRRRVLAEAFEAHPERFVRGRPNPRPVPDRVWINPPKTRSEVQNQGVPQVWVEASGVPQRPPIDSFSKQRIPILVQNRSEGNADSQKRSIIM
jgi:putative transposase